MPNPAEYLVTYSRRYPDAWKDAIALREGKGKDLPDWPDWCFLPLNGYYSIVSKQVGEYYIKPKDAEDISILGALGAWRYTQGVYRFHEDLYAALLGTEFDKTLPCEVLMRLPEWCIYVETPDTFFEGKPQTGYFSFLDYDTERGTVELRFVVDQGGELRPTLPVYLGDWTLAEAIEKGLDFAKRNLPSLPLPADAPQRGAELMAPMLSPLLYLCQDEPEIGDRTIGDHPANPRPVKTKKGLRLFPPDKPRVWKVGFETGEKLRQAKETESRRPETGPHTRRAHIRRAHWHGYWTGPRKPKPDAPEGTQQRRFGYRWLHPMLVSGSGESGEDTGQE